jgi:hypothetical protein
MDVENAVEQAVAIALDPSADPTIKANASHIVRVHHPTLGYSLLRTDSHFSQQLGNVHITLHPLA